MVVYSVWIVNKAGGLIYQRIITEGFHPKLTSNDHLVIASTFQSIYAISRKVSPVPGSEGVESIEWQSATDPYTIHCLHTMTGVKFLLSASTGHPHCEALLYKIYALYADYALKDPFYVPEMTLRSDLFDKKLIKVASI